MPYPVKISDSNQQITRGSRADNYWLQHGMKPYFSKMRPGFELPKRIIMANNIDEVVAHFQLSGIGFGNWVTTEDRSNYLNAMIIAFADLNRVLRFAGNNVGVHKHLAVTFGARGRGKALAHYEPGTQIINLTRYKDEIFNSEPKEVRFLGTGGVGSFAHEYGHFLDYFAGQYLDHDRKTLSLSGGDRTITARIDAKGPLRFVMDELLEKIIWSSPGKLSPYYNRMKRTIAKEQIRSDYFIQRNEIFARAFEVFIQLELRRLNITNRFLTDRVYTNPFYLTEKEMKKLLPIFRKLISDIRDRIK